MGNQKIKWSDYSELDLLTRLKEEIIRIGIEDYPSKTQYNKLYNRENAMSASSYLNRFDKSWDEIIEMIGLEYDKKSMAKKRGSKGKGVTREEYVSKWDLLNDDELISALYKEIFTNGNRTQKMYVENRDKDNAPSLSYITNRLGTWTEIKKRIKGE